jgi:hypothetical protein
MVKIIKNKIFDYKVHHENMNIIKAYDKKQTAKKAKMLQQAYDDRHYNKYLRMFEAEDEVNFNLGLNSINR